jgi:EmrB/QacA subfamily drug resistance transporter
VAVTLAIALAPLNSTMVIVGLPKITDDFDAPLSSAGWLVTGYLIAVAALQTPAGKLGDRVGHRRLFLGGLVAFLATSVAAAAAPNLAWLIVFRTGQGITGAIVFPNGWALLRQTIPAERRARRFGAVGSAIALSAGTGPVLGDAVIALSSWRGTFLVNIVFVVPALLIGRRYLPPSPPEAARAAGRRPFDLAGTAAWLALLLGTAGALNVSVRSGRPLLLVLIAPFLVVFGVWFVRRELAHPDPVLQPRFFANRAFAAVNVGIGCQNLAMYVTLLAVPIILERQPGGPGPGLVLGALTLVSVVVSPLGGRLADRLGRRTPAVVGLGLSALTSIPLVIATDGIPVGLLVGCLAVSGVGLGLSSAAMQTTSLESVPPEDAGVASGVYSTSRYLGSILGSSILAASGDPASRPIFLMVLAAAVIAAVSVTRIPRHVPAA